MRRPIFYGWIIVAVTALVLLATAGVRAAPGAFLLSMQDEPGWQTVALVADTIGRLNVGIVYGWVFAAHQLGAAVAAFVAGVVRESVGDYAAAFVAAGWIAIIAGFAALAIRRREPSIEPVPAAAA